MRKKMMPILVAVVFIIVISLIAAGTVIIQKYTPTKEESDLQEYYQISEEDEMSIVLDNVITGETCRYRDGHAYLSYEFVRDQLNSRFYWDSNENILRYTTPDSLISVEAGSSQYTEKKENKEEDYTIAWGDGDTMYLAVDFVQKYTNIDFAIYEEPNRLLLTSQWGDVETSTLKKKTQIREKGGIKSPIVAHLEKGTKVTILEQGEDWSKVSTQDGMIGYLKNKTLGEESTETLSRDFEEPVFTHNLKSQKINMVWHQVTVEDANSQVSDLLQDTKGVNVISPTWFYLNDNKGNIHSLASSSYVSYCHQNNIEVWALVSNLENQEVDTAQVLTHTSTRDRLVNKIIAAAIEYDLDGINLDFEELSSSAGDAYVQFIRELSLKCKNNGIVLSVDNYVPTDYTAFYDRAEQANFADYVVVMGYDEHYAGCEEAGSVASIGFVTDGVNNTLKEVPAEQVILGMPFYTRVWACTPKEDSSELEQASDDYIPYTVTSTAVGMTEAQNRLAVNGVEAQWSEEDGQNYGEYEQDGVTYRIWLEDADSMALRLSLVKDKGLAGGAYWKLGLEKSSIWDTIIKYIN